MRHGSVSPSFVAAELSLVRGQLQQLGEALPQFARSAGVSPLEPVLGPHGGHRHSHRTKPLFLATLERTELAGRSRHPRGRCPRSRCCGSSTCLTQTTGRALVPTPWGGAQKNRARQKRAGAPDAALLEKHRARSPGGRAGAGVPPPLSKLKEPLCGCPLPALRGAKKPAAFHIRLQPGGDRHRTDPPQPSQLQNIPMPHAVHAAASARPSAQEELAAGIQRDSPRSSCASSRPPLRRRGAAEALRQRRNDCMPHRPPATRQNEVTAEEAPPGKTIQTIGVIYGMGAKRFARETRREPGARPQ